MKIYDKIIECRNNNIERKKREEWSAKRIQKNVYPRITHDYSQVFVNYYVNARRPCKSSVNSPQGSTIILIERWNIARDPVARLAKHE